MQVHVWVWLTLLCLYLELQSCGENYFYWPEIRRGSGKVSSALLKAGLCDTRAMENLDLSGAAGGLVGHPVWCKVSGKDPQE